MVAIQVGDIARVIRTGLEVEVIGINPTNPGLILCAWIDELDDYQEVYFRICDLTLIKHKEKVAK